MVDNGIVSTASYPETQRVAMSILSLLSKQHTSVAYGMLGSGLAICRLATSGERELKAEEEVQFLQALMEWVGLYWVEGKMN